MTVQMDDRYASALREALIDHVQTAPAGRQRAARRLALGAAAGVLLVVAGGAAAVAAGILRLPGSPDVAPLAKSITVTGEGTQTVELGAPPAGTTELEIRLACLTAGTFLTADGASLVCDASSAGTGEMGWHLAVALGQHTTVITAGAGERWRLVATYVHVTDTEWAVNADGLTYGVANDRGTPDLIAAIASNGKVGYVYSRDLIEPAPPTSLQIGAPTGQIRTIPVYTSDGHTVIGQISTGVNPSTAP